MSIDERYFQSRKAFSQSIASNQEPLLAGIKVLLVEDELDLAELLLILLEGVGAEVFWTTRAEEALTTLRQFKPDILVSNVRLPQENGEWLIRQIRAGEMGQLQHLPAIAVTSYTREVSKARALAAGFEQFLSKTDDPDALISTIAQLVENNEQRLP